MSISLILQKVASDSGIVLGAKVLMVAIVYATHLTLAWLYGPELMGTFFIATNLIIFIGTASTLGLDLGMLRFAALLQEENRDGLIWSLAWRSSSLIMGLSALLALMVYLGRYRLASYLNATDLLPMLNFFVLALPIFSVGYLLRETLRGLGAVLWATISQYVIQPGVLLVLILLFSILPLLKANRGQALSLAFCFSVLLTLAVLLWLLRVRNRGKSIAASDGQLWKNLCSYSWPFLVITILQIIMTVADSLILALFRPPAEVAYYTSAVKLASFVGLPLIAINSVIPPHFVQLYQRREMKELEHLVRTTARWLYYFALPICLLVILLSSELLEFFGAEFRTARWGLNVMAFSHLVSVAVGSVYYLLFMTGNQRVALKLRGLVVFVTLPLMFLLAYRYGVNGVALARAGGIALVNVLGAGIVWKVVGIKIFAKDILPLTMAALLAFGLSWVVRLRWEALWGAITFGIVYLIILSGVVWRREEWRFLSNNAAK